MRRVAQACSVRDHLGTDTVQETQSLAANGPASAATPASCSSRNLLVTTRNTLVFMPPHKPLSVVTTMTPTFLASFTCMNGCTYSGLASPRWAAMLRIFRCMDGQPASVPAPCAFWISHHFHGFGDLLGVFHRFDLAAYFLTCCHDDSSPVLSEGLLECSNGCSQFSFVLAFLVESTLFVQTVQQSSVAGLQELVQTRFEGQHLTSMSSMKPLFTANSEEAIRAVDRGEY